MKKAGTLPRLPNLRWEQYISKIKISPDILHG
jgi:hypothetical protein